MAKNNKKRDVRLSNLKRKSKPPLPKHLNKEEEKNQNTHNQSQDIATYKQKLTVYENIIQELREQLHEKNEIINDFETKEVEIVEQDLSEITESNEVAEDITSKEQIASEYISKIADLETRVKSLHSEVEDWKIKSIRISADLQNMQKQSELDIHQAKKSAKKNTVISLMDFLNTLNISFNFIPDTDDEKVKNFINTLKMSFDKVINELKSSGIEVLRVDIGDTFDPEYMNILSIQESENGTQDKVSQIVGLGLKIDGQLVQPASVIVR
jgi:molecular chaperone GrpE